ncbi:substrate-binding domain-containing protein [Boseongicola aestuarii]|jgi:tungstate transport system substrate-binding protein|uniref:PBP superfamily domain protein n=1 Tax=Boseongicola aestuarii TaxID=1470561 RepID=A0A238J3A0_9RHOB|nr:substrate-binding domain-containing protein [Boseongicola aestuarii]SMX24813.1 PBP superfamily domain protein [Boseongicola aestuarii]
MIARLIAVLTACCIALTAQAEPLRLAVTTSFQNSGLSDVLLPEIAADTGLDVQLLVVGTGQAIRLGEAGDVDAILVHARAAEEAFVAQGYATHRREIMFNDFVILGPTDDPAHVKSASTAAEALSSIAEAQALFASRGDDSGTHKRELALWEQANITPMQSWYRALGSGMGATLNTAVAMQAYTLSDRASWLNFGNKDGLAIQFSGDDALQNQYAYLPINPARHGHVNHSGARALEDWLVSPKGQALIGTYEIAGETLFTPNAKDR